MPRQLWTLRELIDHVGMRILPVCDAKGYIQNKDKGIITIDMNREEWDVKAHYKNLSGNIVTEHAPLVSGTTTICNSFGLDPNETGWFINGQTFESLDYAQYVSQISRLKLKWAPYKEGKTIPESFLRVSNLKQLLPGAFRYMRGWNHAIYSNGHSELTINCLDYINLDADVLYDKSGKDYPPIRGIVCGHGKEWIDLVCKSFELDPKEKGWYLSPKTFVK